MRKLNLKTGLNYHMAYRNKTYVAFDGINDMWAYRFMRGWKKRDIQNFNFHDAHDLKQLTTLAQNEKYIKGILRYRLLNSKSFILLVGTNTKYLKKYVNGKLNLLLI